MRLLFLFFILLTHPAATPDSIKQNLCPAEMAMEKAGLVNVQALDATIQVEIKYSTTDNFIGFDVYGCLDKAYLQKDVALKLVKASALLRQERPDLRLRVYDAARPSQAQKILWDSLKKPESQKHVYVANPKKGSIHNYGCAVDLTLCNAKGVPLDMGTPYDFYGLLAQPRKEKEFVQTGVLSKTAYAHRLLLRRIMKQAGFMPITSEWWHFNGKSLKEARTKYKPV